MPRPPRQKMKLDFDSMQSHLQEVYNQLEELRQKAVKDYNKVQTLLQNPADFAQLEPARNNALKSLDTFHSKKIELLKVHLSVVQAAQKTTTAVEGEGGSTAGTSAGDMQKWYAELKALQK